MGRYLWNQRTPEALSKAISFFLQAIAEDPSYALAYAGLADSYTLLIGYDPAPHGSNYRFTLLAAERLPRAKEAARRALELDGNLAEAHAALGLVGYYEHAVNGGDWSAVEREFRRAIELNPRYATAHQWYAWLLFDTGRPDEARTEIDRARQLDPTSPIINAASASLHNFAYEYPQAIDDANKALELNPDFASARITLAVAYMQTRRYDEALAELEAVGRSDSQRDAARGVLAQLEDRAGQDVSPVALASVHVALGDKDAAFLWLDKAYTERDTGLSTLKVAPHWDPLRSDPRFARLLKRLHLE
jgi:tetratricopeptide (TPR) repeat protein